MGQQQEDGRNEVLELQREWRREITDALKELRTQNNQIAESLREMREQFAKHHDVENLEKRVATMEKDKAKVIGGFFALQAVLACVVWLVTRTFK
jgi:gas vesicle protein